jgi:hypothetical protein
MALVYLLISRSLPSNGATCYNIFQIIFIDIIEIYHILKLKIYCLLNKVELISDDMDQIQTHPTASSIIPSVPFTINLIKIAHLILKVK